jgi:HAD superfamily hydrolase (TIGR01549 family)
MKSTFPKNLKGILFDMDGVLIDSFFAWLGLVNQTAKSFGFTPIKEDTFRQVYGQSTHEDVQAFFPGQTTEVIDNFYETHFFDHKDGIHTFEDAKEVFNKLENLNFQIAVVTNTVNNLAKGILEYAKLYPKVLIGGDDVAHGKPEPDMLFLACEKLSINPSQVIMIGDSKFDKESAEKAGIYFIGINGLESEKTINSLSDLMSLF